MGYWSPRCCIPARIRSVVEDAAAAADTGPGQLELDVCGGVVVAGELGHRADLLVPGQDNSAPTPTDGASPFYGMGIVAPGMVSAGSASRAASTRIPRSRSAADVA
jgi:hypothetical protein